MYNTTLQIKKAKLQEQADILNIKEMIKYLKTEEIKKVFLNNSEFNGRLQNMFKELERKNKGE